MADLKISQLPALAGSDLLAADQLAVADTSASETKRITVTDLVGNAVTLIADATIPGAKILFSAGGVAGTAIADGGVTTAKLAADSVTAAKLADESTVDLVTTLPAAGAFTGQIALDTDDSKIYVWNGSAWVSVKGAGSVNVVNGSTTGVVNITSTTSGDTCTIAATLDDTSAAAQFLGGPTGAGGTVGYRSIIGTDLPTPTTSAKGGVIVNGNGLAMSGDTLTVNNTVTAEASENHIVQYDANGLVTGGRVIAAADVPVATSSTVGVIKPGSGLGVDAAGQVSHNNSITAGTAAKVSFDTEGHITATEALAASDIPNIDASKVTTGTFPEARIGSAAVAGSKLKDYAVAQISETTPTAEFTSQFFFNPITRDLFLWDGNVFQPVGISAGEIILAGTYDASTNLLDSVTADGSAAGFTTGQALPAGAAGNNRHYVVVSQSGNGTAPAPTVALEPPDILLSNGSTYVLIETSETITAQVASNVGFTPAGSIASTNVQSAIVEVDNEKAPKANPTLTGTVALGEDAVITFEGATDNAFETTLTVTDPTADRTITLPNVTGTVVTTGDTGSVSSTMIVDGAIVNADINAAAEIAVSKLANGTARQLLQTDSLGSGVEFTSNVDVPGTLDVTGAATLDSTLGVAGLISANGKVKFPAGTVTAPSFHFGTDTNTGLYHPAADKVAITTGGTQRVIVDSSGRVGIGASSPSVSLHVAATEPQFYIQDSNSTGNGVNATIQFRDSSNSQLSYLGFAGASDSHLSLFNTMSGGALRFGTASSERLRIDSSGNVGIGTTSPQEKLHVNGDILIRSNTPNFKLQSPNGSNPYYVAANVSDAVDAGFRIGRGSDLNSGTDFLAITPTGNVGIGTSSPTAKLHVNGSATFAADATIRGLTIGKGNNETGNNTALGDSCLSQATGATIANTAVGYKSGASLTEGGRNTSVGYSSLQLNQTGGYNTCIGFNAGYSLTGSSNTIIGCYSAAAEAGLTGTIILAAGSTERARCNSSGNWQIGGTTAAPNIQLNSNGSITAVGSIDCSDAIASDRASSANNAFVAKLNGSVKATIENGGSATFADTVGSVNGNNRGYLSPGNVNIQNTTLDSTTAFNIQGGRGTGSQADVVTFTTNGSGTFAGYVTATGYNAEPANAADSGLSVKAPGAGTSFYVDGSGTVRLGPLAGSAPKITLNNDGSTSFAADASINGLTVGRGAGNVSSNAATGLNALASNTSGSNNTANGRTTLQANTTGNMNVASGYGALALNTTGSENTASGVGALGSNTTGSYNTASGRSALFSNTTGIENTGLGTFALKLNTGNSNTAVGYQSLATNSTATNNTAAGTYSLYLNTTGSDNTSVGYEALRSNITGGSNCAFGQVTLKANTTASNNSAFGQGSLFANTTGSNNSACGYRALLSNTTGESNSSFGSQSLYSATTGSNNSAFGLNSLYQNTTGTSNSGFGSKSLQENTTGLANTACGFESLLLNTTGSKNTSTGAEALRSCTTGENNCALGNAALYSVTTGSGNIGMGFRNSSGSLTPVFNPTTEDNRLVAGHTSISNAYVKVAWTVTSDERDKMNFAPVPYGLDFVNKLKPTAYQFKVDRDTETPSGDVRYGFKAQDILALEGDNPVIIDTEDADHLKYKGEHLVPVLVNAVQELTTMVDELKAELAALKGA